MRLIPCKALGQKKLKFGLGLYGGLVQERTGSLGGDQCVLLESDELSSKAKIKRNYDNKTSKRGKRSVRVYSFPDRRGGGCLGGAHVPQTWRLLGGRRLQCGPTPLLWQSCPKMQPQISALPTLPSLPGPFCRRVCCPCRWMLRHQRILSSPVTRGMLCRPEPPAHWGRALREGPGVGWGSPAGAAGLGTAAAPSQPYEKPATLLVPIQKADRGGVVLTGKGKMSKQHSPGSFIFFFLTFLIRKEFFFFFNSPLCLCCIPAQRLFFIYLILCKIDLILFGRVRFKSQDEILAPLNQYQISHQPQPGVEILAMGLRFLCSQWEMSSVGGGHFHPQPASCSQGSLLNHVASSVILLQSHLPMIERKLKSPALNFGGKAPSHLPVCPPALLLLAASLGKVLAGGKV